MQPIDYMQGYKNPLQNILDQVKMYQDFSQNANILRSQKAQSELEKATSERKIRAMQDLHNLDFDDESLLKKYVQEYKDLEYSKGIQDHLAGLDEKQKQAEIGRISQTLSLLKNGKKDVAIDDLLAQAQAFENAGDSQNAEGARKMAQLIYQDPNSALDLVGKSYAVMVGKDGMSAYKDFVTTTAPNVQYQNMGGYGQVIKTDPITGDITTQDVGDITQSADNIADNQRAMTVAQGGWQNAQDVAHINGGYNLQERQIQEAGENARTQAELNLKSQLAEQDKLLKMNDWKSVEAEGKMWLVNAQGQYRELINPQTGKQMLSNEQSKKQIDESTRLNKLTASIDEAEKLLRTKGATGSWGGTVWDNGLGKAGIATKGAEITAQLTAIGGQLTSLMPRMEGPQSNVDVEMYKQMAGDVGNSEKPVAVRLAALNKIRQLNEKYSNHNGPQGKKQVSADYNSMKLK